MNVAIIQPSYLPWLGFFEMIDASDAYVAFDHVKFEPSTWQHRNRIKGTGGPFFLTVPILNEKSPDDRICDRRIDHRQPWVRKHVRSLEQCYGKAPFFDRYFPGLRELLESETAGIAELNVGIIRILLRDLGIDRPVIRSSSLPLGDDTRLGKNERLIFLMRTVGATGFYEGASGAAFVDPALFAAEGMEVRFQAYRHPVYPQQHGDFVSHMSVVDLLFNCGEESLEILRKGGARDRG